MCGHTETGMWRHCLRPKKIAFRTFRVGKSASNVLFYMKDLHICEYCPDSRHVPYFIIHCQRLKLNVDFRGESVLYELQFDGLGHKPSNSGFKKKKFHKMTRDQILHHVQI